MHQKLLFFFLSKKKKKSSRKHAVPFRYGKQYPQRYFSEQKHLFPNKGKGTVHGTSNKNTDISLNKGNIVDVSENPEITLQSPGAALAVTGLSRPWGLLWQSKGFCLPWGSPRQSKGLCLSWWWQSQGVAVAVHRFVFVLVLAVTGGCHGSPQVCVCPGDGKMVPHKAPGPTSYSYVPTSFQSDHHTVLCWQGVHDDLSLIPAFKWTLFASWLQQIFFPFLISF